MSEWTKTTVKGVNQRKSKSIKPEDFPNEYFESYSVPTFPSSKPEIVTGDSIKSTKQVVQTGDVLLCKINPRINRVWQVSNFSKHRKIASSEWIVVRPTKDINPSFLRYQWSAPHFRKLMCTDVSGVGGSLTRARPKIVNEYPTYLPDPTTQEKIVTHLDTFFVRHAALQSAVERLPGMLADFRAAVLHQAVTGELTKEWSKKKSYTDVDDLLADTPAPDLPNRFSTRTQSIIPGRYAVSVGAPDLAIPKRYRWVPLYRVAEMGSGHTPSRKHPEWWDGDVNWIGIKDAREHHSGTIWETMQKTNALGLENSAARLLPANTVCFSRTASVGYVVKMGISMATSQDFVNWTCTEVVDPDWLKWLLVAEKDSMISFGKGSTHTTIYYPELLSLHVALPPIEEQREIVRQIEQLFALAEKIEHRIISLKKQVDYLPQAVLAKVFAVQE